MRVFEGFDNLPRLRNPIVTVGSYDGVHAGHRKLLDKIAGIARGTNGESVVVTFSPHPREVLAGGDRPVGLLTTLPEKTLLLKRAGVDNLLIAPFTTEFSRLSSYDFVKQYLVDRLGVRTLVVGYNHHFGRDKTGDFSYLERMSGEFGFDIYMVPRHDVDEDKVSSTVIRNLIGSGGVTDAARLLGYRYFIMGHACAGGGFRPGEPSKLLPAAGRYPVAVAHGGGMSLRGELSVAADGTLSVSPPVEGATTVTFI